MNDKASDGNDLRSLTGWKYYNNTPKPWSDVGAAQRGYYFSVMPLGYYEEGRLYMQNNYMGYYWSSTGYPNSTPGTYSDCLWFGPSQVAMYHSYDGYNHRKRGYPEWTGE